MLAIACPSLLPHCRFQWQSARFSQLFESILGRYARPWVVDCRLKYTRKYFAPKIGVWLQIPMLTEDDEDGLAWIMEYPFVNESEKPIGQPRRKIGTEAQSTLLRLRP